ncbi:ribonuclease H-like domain-containing protein [Tanacetum coccineum]
MVTRSQSGIVKPIDRLSLHTSPISPIPKSSFLALNKPPWSNAMYDEYNALHKFHANGTLSRYKARLVANGSSQQLGVDIDETFSPVVKPATICMVLSLIVSRKWLIHQLDVKNAFLNGDSSENRSLYGLKQAPRAWFQRFAGYATRAGFSHSRCDSSLFIYTQGSQVAYLLIYMDDIILTVSSLVLLQQIINSLHKEFDMTDLEALNYFLGMFVVRHSTRLFLSQKKYALQLLERAYMVHCNPSRTPVDTESKLGPDGVPVQDLTLYRSLAGGLRYLTFTRPDLCYAVQHICLYMHDPREPHFVALKHIFHNVKGTLDFGFHLYASATTSLHTISCSNAKAEYYGITNVVAETAWLRNLLHELHSPLMTATLVYCDNVRVLHIPSRFQFADIFTMLPSTLFEDFRSSLSVRPPLAKTARAY